MLRLLLDRGRLDDAELIEKSIRPEWGAGRDTQLIDLKQMSARLQMLRGQPARALATLQEALALADDARLSEPERASCLTDLVQLLIANKRDVESVELLEKLTSKHGGRDGEVFRCLLELLQAWRGHVQDEDACRGRLSAGLGRAQRVRYTMFFRLLPRLAAELCALALRWQIEPTFVVEIIRTRDLRAPDAADERWPWTVYVRMLGGFDLRVRGEFDPHKAGRKVPKKPLELLRAIACENEMAISVAAAADALWPDAEGDQARKNLETTVQRLRRLLGDHDNSLVLVGDGQVALDPRRVTSDVVQRRALIKRLETMASRPEAAGEYAAVALRIAELSRGGLLPGVPDSPWLETERRRCERDALRAQRAAPTTTENAFPGELDRPK